MATANNGNSHISRAFRWIPPRWRRPLLLVVIYVLAGLALEEVGGVFETAEGVTVWDPSSSLDFVLLLKFGLYYTPALLLFRLVDYLWVTPLETAPFYVLVFCSFFMMLIYGTASALLLYPIEIDPDLHRLRDVFWFIAVAAFIAPLLASCFFVTTLAAAGSLSWSIWASRLLHDWAGEATGIAMLAPPLLILLRAAPVSGSRIALDRFALPININWLKGGKALELGGEIFALIFVGWAAYSIPSASYLNYTYFVFLPLIWIAVRQGFERAAIAVSLTNVTVAVFVKAKFDQANPLALQFGLMTVSLSGLLLGAVFSDRQEVERELRYAAKRLEVLYAINRAILAARSPLEIAQAALQQMRQLIPCQWGSIGIFDLEAREFTVAVQTEIQSQPTRLPLSAFGDIRVLQRGEVNMVQDTLTISELPSAVPPMLDEAVRAYINVPLISQGELIGSLNLGKDSPGAFAPKLINVAQEVANLLAIAIQQERLFSQVEQQATRERSLNQISRTLNSSLDPEQILQEIVQLTGQYFSVDRVILFAIPNQQIQVLNEWRISGEVVSVLDLEIPLPEFSTTNDFQYRQVFHAPDVTQMQLTSGTQSRVQQTQLLSVLSVPILVRDQLFGRLSLQTTTTRRTFTDDEIYLLERIADQAAIALYNAQSYERLEELVKERTQELEQEKFLSEAANRAKSDFLSNMSHELRTPLTSVLGCSSILLEHIFGPLNAKQKQYIELISTSGKHLLELITDLLDLSKIEVGREELVLETVVVEEIVDMSMSMIQERAKNNNLQLSLMVAADVTTCVADKRRLKQILVNLLSNAVKFTESGSVTLRVNQTADKINFSVIDTGIGIAQADQATLFQAFHQVDNSLNRKYEGTGLGLALSRKLAQLHGGDITVHSELEQGSCFTLQLPLDLSPEANVSSY